MQPEQDATWMRFIPGLAAGLCCLWVLAGLYPSKEETAFDLQGFGELPVLNGGRIKPLDSVARNSLLALSGTQELRTPDGTVSALPWLLDVLFRPDKAAASNVFEIDNPDVLGVMGIMQTNRRRFAFTEIEPHEQEIEQQATQAESVKSEQRSAYHRAILNLENQLTLYQKLQNTLQISGTDHVLAALRDFEQRLGPALQAHLRSPARATELIGPLMKELERYRFLDHVAEFYALPPTGWWKNESWMTLGNGVLARLHQEAYHPGIIAYARMADAWRGEDPAAFNAAVHDYQAWLAKMARHDAASARREYVFNHFQPFYRSMVIYVLVLLMACFSWLAWSRTLNRTAYFLLLAAFATHTTGLVWRIILQNRPPVTNLYSSAIFVGWVAVLLGLILERLYRNGIGSAVASAIGFATLLIAHHLAASGDTLEMMRAVLDSNFWLATHVVCITIGYGSTFLSGFLATLYIIRQRFDRSWNEDTAMALERMVYGVVCFSLLFSFIGTILGGIWADQSWGRFWGWDPKENGALMIVLWNAFILHARIGKLTGRRGVMTMAVFGNVVTAFSWFGVNMLGIGLHSYGFMDKAFFWLIAFAVSQLALIAMGLMAHD